MAAITVDLKDFIVETTLPALPPAGAAALAGSASFPGALPGGDSLMPQSSVLFFPCFATGWFLFDWLLFNYNSPT